ncbi:MAG: Ppx/GppA family phosphatase [Paracoccaceae bacterium]
MNERVAVIDVGSNSVRLVVFDGAARSPAYFFNEKVLAGLGTGLAQSGYLHPEGRRRAMAALHRFAALLQRMRPARTMTIATAAVRDAIDGPEFCAQVLAETGLALTVASGPEEGRLSAQGVLLGWPEAEGMVCDIGGASLELAQISGGQVLAAETAPLGPLPLLDLKATPRELRKRIKRDMAKLRSNFSGPVPRLFLVGGSWRAVARLDMARRKYPLHVLHEYERPTDDVMRVADWISRQEPAHLATVTDTSLDRLRLLPTAALVLMRLLKDLRPETVAFSSYGIREGMLYEAMPPDVRALDPLIEACRYTETQNARFPGFGDALYGWLQNLFGDLPADDLRLMRAACLLHDTTWRAHPDYRADMCFEEVTRANMGGVDHAGRLFLAVANRARYKNDGSAVDDHPAIALLAADRVKLATAIGRAMRLGAMLGGAHPDTLPDTELQLMDGQLRLELHGPARELMGEVVERRLNGLNTALGLTEPARLVCDGATLPATPAP